MWPIASTTELVCSIMISIVYDRTSLYKEKERVRKCKDGKRKGDRTYSSIGSNPL